MLGFALTEAVGLLALMMAFLISFDNYISICVPLSVTLHPYKKTLEFWGHFQRLIMRDVKVIGFAYYRIFIVRISTIYALILYGILFKVYKVLQTLPIIGYILKAWDRIYFVQTIAVYLYPLPTCAFHMGLHSFLMGMEDIYYYLNQDSAYLNAIHSSLKVMRRSPLKMIARIGRVGSDGFSGGMGEPPHGNWRRLVAWTGVALTAIAAKAAVEIYKSKQQTKISIHESDNRKEASKYEEDAGLEARKYESDNKTKVDMAKIQSDADKAKFTKKWWYW
jgi:hypothetical protein